MLQIVQAYDRRPIAEVETEGADALEAKLELAARSLRDRDQWLKPHERIEVLYRLASLMEPLREKFSRLIAQEGGKPLVDAGVEANRAIDGVRNAAEELRNFAGREIPMGLTAASTGRWAFTTREPIGVVVAISAFNRPLNLIVHQVAPANCHRLPGYRKACSGNSAVLPRIRAACARGRPCRTLVPDLPA